MIPRLVINRLSKQVTRTDSILLPTKDWVPTVLPQKGDNVTVNGLVYVVSHTHWDFDEQTITVYASRRDD